MENKLDLKPMMRFFSRKRKKKSAAHDTTLPSPARRAGFYCSNSEANGVRVMTTVTGLIL